MKQISKAFTSVKKTYSLPFWSWNDKLDEERLREQIGWLKDREFGGFFMHARAGLKTEYLSDEWMACISACIDEAKRLGLEPWAYDENGWPSGFCGGKLLENPEYLENYLQYTIGRSDESAMVVYDISSSALRRLKDGESAEYCLNVFKRTAVSSVDVLDEKVVKEFIAQTHEKYKQKLGDKFKDLCGFFTDEPQFCRVSTVYPHVIAKEYESRYGKDILDYLGLLFVEKEGYREFRYEYWKLCQELFLNSFAKQIYDWCENNGVQFTGHYIEERDLYAQMLFNAGIMPFYEYEHIPGIDWLCRRFMSVVPVRQIGSVAAQLGKKRVMSETFAMTGWDATPTELKAIAEFQFLYGINTICQHLVPYSELGERKNDYPEHFSSQNPWVNESMGEFNDYFNTLGGIMQSSEEYVNVAVLHPQRSAYFGFKHGDFSSTAELDAALIDISDYLARTGIGFHYLDETLLAKYGFVRDGKIGCAKKEYSYLIIPKCYTMDKTTEKLIREFVRNGGKVYLASDKPEYLEGKKYDYDYLNANVTIEEIRRAQPYSIDTAARDVYTVYRKCDGYDFLMLLNTNDEKVADVKISVNGSAYEQDLSDNSEKAIGEVIALKPYESKIIVIYPEKEKKEKEPTKKKVVLPSDGQRITAITDNALVLDYARYSLNGVDYTDKRFIYGIFDELLKARYEGDLYLDFEFEVESVPTTAKILSEYGEASITVNGVEAKISQPYAKDKNARVIDVSELLREGKNNVEVKVRFYQSEKVYYTLFGEGVTESLKNCLVYDTYLERLTLLGDFGVFSRREFEPGIEKNVLYGDEFYIGEKKTVISDLVKDGYPFFSGSVEIAQKIHLDTTDVELRVPGRLFSGEIYVNDKRVGSLTFSDTFDLSMVANIGDNDVRIVMHTGCRNLNGPHHDARAGECKSVTPFAFTLPKTWKDGYSVIERKSYAFMRTGVFK